MKSSIFHLVKLSFQLLKQCRLRILWKFCYNFGMRNLINIARFERRIKKGDPFFPAFVMISVTSSCNLSCSGCWVSQKPKSRLTIKQLNGIIEQSKRQGSYFFGILGGEPLMYEGLFDLFKSHSDCYFQLFTNGTLIGEKEARQMREAGNVTPLFSIEGLERESDLRRGGDDVFIRTLKGVEACRKEGLILGAAASICRSSLDDLVTPQYLDLVAAKGIHYLWYYIYRPVGPDPNPDNALTQEEIHRLRQFMVEQRPIAPVMIVDAYWDDKGEALCPGAVGLSHHIAPNGAVEFCPPLQAATDFLNDDASNLTDIFRQSQFLAGLRKMTAETSRGCILLENPDKLLSFIEEHRAIDSSGRARFMEELRQMRVQAGHDMKEKAIPEKDAIFALVKKNYFFGFGAYG